MQYHEYIQSEAWKQKRAQRLAISNNQCAVCGTGRNLEVHHLTYARIFSTRTWKIFYPCASSTTQSRKAW